MKNDNAEDSSTGSPRNVNPSPVENTGGKKKGKTKSRNKETGSDKNKSFKRSWKSAGPVAKYTLVCVAITAAAGVLYLIAFLVTSRSQTSQNQEHFNIEHAPLVIHSRPPQLLMPITCDVKRSGGGLTTGNVQAFIKNIGPSTAADVNAMYVIPKIVPEKKTGHPIFDDPPIGDCGAAMQKTSMDFPLAPGTEVSLQIRQAVTTLPPIQDGETVQFYMTECVYYKDSSTNSHGTCDT